MATIHHGSRTCDDSHDAACPGPVACSATVEASTVLLLPNPRIETMHAERSPEEKFELPQDLVAAASTRTAAHKQQEYYRVEAFKPSFFGRVAEMFGGGKRR